MKKAKKGKRLQKHDPLDKRLLSYSLLAGAVIAGGAARSEVQKTSREVTLTTDQDTLNIVFNGELKFKIKLQTYQSMYKYYSYYPNTTSPTTTYTYTYWATTNSVGIYAKTDNAFWRGGTGYSTSGPLLLESGSHVKGADWGRVTTFFYNMAYYSYLSSNYGYWTSWSSGHFLGESNKFIGVKFNLSGNTHYGWIKVSVGGWAQYITIHEFAHEESIGQDILAGSDVSLSVAMTELTAVQEKGSVVLNWTTQSEVNNLGFVLERRRLDGEGKPETEWQVIGSFETHPELRGRGNSSEKRNYQFEDVQVASGETYEYRIFDMDTKGHQGPYHEIIVTVNQVPIPETLTLEQNYPNPFNPKTTISFGLPEEGHVKLTVYNLQGQLVKVLRDQVMEAGVHTVTFGAQELVSGTYLYEVKAGGLREVKRMVVVK